MSKSSAVPIPLYAEDISAFARSLSSQLKAQLHTDEAPVGHVELLNILARASGHRNYQHMRASLSARTRLENPVEAPAESVDFTRVERIAKYFDAAGRMSRWPISFSLQEPCLWVMWSRVPAATVMTERELNEKLKAEHLFGDHAILRRELVERGLLRRPLDCMRYERIERKPPPEARELIRLLEARRRH